MSTWIIQLGASHEPFTKPFERHLFNRLHGINYKGIVLLDGIHLNQEMELWWKEVQANAAKNGYTCYDVTSVGHSTGTGFVDFTGKAKIEVA